MTMNSQHWLAASGAVWLAAAMAASVAFAQQPPGPAPRPPAAPPAAKAPAPARDAAPAGDAALRQRVEQLEEQLVDMQVVVGTLESLARGATAPSSARQAPGAAISASDAGRLDGIETQIRALAAQLEQLQEQMRALGGRSGTVPQPSPHAANEPVPAPGPVSAPRPGRPQPDAGPSQPERTGFGAVTVSPDKSEGEKDDIDRLLNPPPPGAPPGPRVASAPAAPADANSKQLYETAYGYLLQRDYGAAEAAFDDFLRRHPNDPLAGNAQYWLGESLYVRGQYRAAAGAFLKGYQTYNRSTKAPESLLKLAMSLQRLGQKDAACSSYNELTTKFPNAPTHVKTSAQTERQRAGC